MTAQLESSLQKMAKRSGVAEKKLIFISDWDKAVALKYKITITPTSKSSQYKDSKMGQPAILAFNDKVYPNSNGCLLNSLRM